MAEQARGQLTSKELQDLKRLKMVKEALEEYKRRGVSADIPVCPVCKSARIVHITSFQDLGYIGRLQPAYYCLDCGWYGRSLTIMTNRPEDDVVIEDLKGAFSTLLENDEESKGEYREEDES